MVGNVLREGQTEVLPTFQREILGNLLPKEGDGSWPIRGFIFYSNKSHRVPLLCSSNCARQLGFNNEGEHDHCLHAAYSLMGVMTIRE